MLGIENTRLAGYTLTLNRFMFLDTDGNVARLFHCPKISLPRRVLDKCCDRIPILL